MSDKQKASLARGSVYPATLLSESEKSNLIKNQWQPVGPAGVEGEDYTARTLYVLKELEHDKIADQIVAAGLRIDEQHYGIIPIPEQGGRLILELSSLDGTALQATADLTLNWFGRKRDQRWQKKIRWQKGPERELWMKGGLLRIASSESFLLHAFLETGSGERLDITPKPLLIKAYAAEHSVDYAVIHVDDKQTAIRVDIRRTFGLVGETPGLPEITYQWLNSQGYIVRQGTLSINALPSVYDRLRNTQAELKVSDPVSYYFNLPATVSRLRLLATYPGLLVNAYNQPYQFQKKQRVPENSFISVDKKDWYPAWFMLKPENERTLLKGLAVKKIAGQYRPPEDDPAIKAGQYLWEDYVPQENTEARYLLTEMDTLDYRDEALANIYCQIPANKIQRFNFQAYGSLSQIAPELVYLRKQKYEFEAAVSIDRRPNFILPAIGQQGVMKLSKLNQGNHHIKVDSDKDIRWLINFIKGCSSKLFLKRRVFKFNNRQLTFMYHNEKTADSVFSARFYAETGTRRRSVIAVNIKPLSRQPLKPLQDSWTFTRRHYDIRPDTGKAVVLYQQNQRVNNGEGFFIPFNKDMPEGWYRITLKLKQGPTGYLALSRINPGFHEQRRFCRETYEQND